MNDIFNQPNLIDPIGMSYLKKTLSNQPNTTNTIAGPLDFLKDSKKMYWFCFIMFFILVILFLYWKYHEKKKTITDQNIDAFVGSVNNFLYATGSDEYV